MAIADLEVEHLDQNLNSFVSQRRESIDGETTVYFSYTIHDQSVSLVEHSPDLHDSQKVTAVPFADISYDEDASSWKVVFLKTVPDWHAYEPEVDPEVESFKDALRLIRRKSKHWYV